MLVDPKANVARTNATASARRPASAGQTFEPDSSTATARAASTSSVAAPQSMDALLALQIGDDPQERRRRSVQHGREVLDELDRLKAALLSGRIPAGELLRLAHKLGQRPAFSGDPRLDDIIGQIELRAQVELAKLQRAPRSS